jgi:phosphoserine phosphatase
VELWSPDRVWARVETMAREQPGGILATDGDGTLWSGDVGEDLFHGFLRDGPVMPAAFEALGREAREHHLSDAGTGPDIARRIYSAYQAGGFPEERVCELMTWCFAGWRKKDARSFAAGVVRGSDLASRWQGEVVQVIERARDAGIRVILVSASPFDVVAEAGAAGGFEEDDIVAARPRYEGEVMLAEVERPIPYAAGKVTRLQMQAGEGHVAYAAFGDNVFDIALLTSARLGVAVRPKPRLVAKAHEVEGLVQLERDGPIPSKPPRGR